MTLTYLLMLFFVFITLFVIGIKRIGNGLPGDILTLLWALLGTFFFHNIW